MKIRVVIDFYFTDPQYGRFEKVCDFARFPDIHDTVDIGRFCVGEISSISHQVAEGQDWCATVVCCPYNASESIVASIKAAGFIPSPTGHEAEARGEVMCLSRHLTFIRYRDDEHHAFVFKTFADSLAETPQIGKENRALYEFSLRRALVDPRTKACMVTPSGSPGEFLGWAVALPTCLVYAYVRFRYRRGKLGPPLVEAPIHLGTELIENVTEDRELPAAIWTVDASRMAANGFPLRYDLDENERFRQLAR